MAGVMTIPGWTLEICCYHSLGLADVQSDHFPEKSFHAFLKSTLMGPICPSAHRTSLLLHLVASVSLISSACMGTICGILDRTYKWPLASSLLLGPYLA